MTCQKTYKMSKKAKYREGAVNFFLGGAINVIFMGGKAFLKVGNRLTRHGKVANYNSRTPCTAQICNSKK